jgi:hypothetical protein
MEDRNFDGRGRYCSNLASTGLQYLLSSAEMADFVTAVLSLFRPTSVK